eukprot:1160938-Pelagomonas_calceolata.AAC.15
MAYKHDPLGNTVKRKEKSTLAKRPRALRKGSLTSKLERVSPEGTQCRLKCTAILQHGFFYDKKFALSTCS